jgi:outer membrane protein assembly factor BamB
MRLIHKSSDFRYIAQDIESKKVYIQVNKSEGQSLLMSDLDKVECELSNDIIIREIYNNLIFSWLNADGKIYDFSEDDVRLIKEINNENIYFNNRKVKFFISLSRNGKTFIKCFTTNDFKEIYEFEREKFTMPLIYFEDKIVLVNELGTKLFFYENDTLLFTKDIPLYYTMVVNIHRNPKSTNQAFKLITKYEHQLICGVNDERIISVDINTGDILWELTDKEIEGGSDYKSLFFCLEVYGTAVDNIIHVLQSSIYMQIDIVTRQAKLVKDFKVNDLNIVGINCAMPTLYKNKFYFLITLASERMNTNNKFGVFNLDTLTLEQVIEVEIPIGHFLMSNPIVDDKYVYLRDSENSLYIYEREVGD